MKAILWGKVLAGGIIDKMLTFKGPLGWARQCAKGFTGMVSFNAHINLYETLSSSVLTDKAYGSYVTCLKSQSYEVTLLRRRVRI